MDSPIGTTQEFGRPSERRIDPTTQKQVIELAARLQERDRDHVSEWELEQLAEEAGLSREFVREALRQIDTPKSVTRVPAQVKLKTTTSASNPTWFVVIATLFCFGWGALCAGVNGPYGREVWPLVMAIPMTALLGYFAGRRQLAMFFGVFLALMTIANLSGGGVESIVFTMCSGALISLFGCWLRERIFPIRDEEPIKEPASLRSDDRLERLERLRLLRNELEGERTRRAFVSVDVVGSFRIKQDLGELEAERLFGRYQRWVADVVMNHGGEIQASAGDGAMAMFPNGLSALRAARALTRGVAGFNQQNGGDLHIRCGISEGQVPWRPGQPIGGIQSPVLDRAAVRQKSAPVDGVAVGEELVGEAAVEFGSLEAVVTGGTDRVFVCRSGG